MLPQMFGGPSAGAIPLLTVWFTLQRCIVRVGQASASPACQCVTMKPPASDDGYGTVTSPNYPRVYSPGISCVLYSITAGDQQIVELQFVNFDMAPPIRNRCVDYIRLYLDLESPAVNERHTWNYELCDAGLTSSGVDKYYSSTRWLLMALHTDKFTSNHTGFRAFYRFLDKRQFEMEGGSRRWGSQCAYDFYSTRSSVAGRFFSPNYPQHYPPDTRCQYAFHGKPSERVKITFHNFSLEQIDGSCIDNPDYVVVRDGVDDNSSPVLARYCGNLLAGDVIPGVVTSSNRATVEFVSNARNQRQGFAGLFTFIASDVQHAVSAPASDDTTRASTLAAHQADHQFLQPKDIADVEADLSRQNPGDSPASSSSSSSSSSLSTSERFPSVVVDSSSDHTNSEDCSRYIDSKQQKSGMFSSPNYPDSYPSDVTCLYTFQGHGRERVQVTFVHFRLRHHVDHRSVRHRKCDEVDSLRASVTSSDGGRSDVGIYCDDSLPPMLMSGPSGRLQITLTSMSPPSLAAASRTGFAANFSFVTDFGIKAGKQNHKMDCAFTFNNDDTTNGTFTSPNFPGLYPRNIQCHYLFYGADKSRVYITFPYFDVDGIPPRCNEASHSDFVEFSNFNVELTDRKMARYCGTKNDIPKKTVTSDGNFFRVTFHSNHVYDSTGFEAFYQFRRVEDLSATERRHAKIPDSSAVSYHRIKQFLHLSIIVILHGAASDNLTS